MPENVVTVLETRDLTLLTSNRSLQHRVSLWIPLRFDSVLHNLFDENLIGLW